MKRIFVAVFIIVVGMCSPSQVVHAITVDGDLSDWGLDPSASDWTPDPGIVGIEEDSTDWYVGPGVGGNEFDAEGMYVVYSEPDSSLCIAVVTGTPPGGATYNGITYPPGDIAIDFGQDGTYEIGIETTGSNAGSVVLNPDWTIPTDFPDSGPSNMVDGTGTEVASVPLAYNDDTYAGHYVIEVSVPVGAFDNLWGNSFTVHWTMECGNDLLDVDYTPPVPEPSTVLLLGTGLLVTLAAHRSRRSRIR